MRCSFLACQSKNYRVTYKAHAVIGEAVIEINDSAGGSESHLITDDSFRGDIDVERQCV
jgi:hypothetical protein